MPVTGETQLQTFEHRVLPIEKFTERAGQASGVKPNHPPHWIASALPLPGQCILMIFIITAINFGRSF
jgi:hypothetical protein